MNEKRYYWLRLQNDFFDSLRIKKLRKLAGGDTFTIIYLKMQLKCLIDGGCWYYKGIEDTFAEEVALDIDEDVENVKITIQYLLACGLMEVTDDQTYTMPYVLSNVGSETASAQRVRDCRQRKKDQKALHCNNDVTEVKQVCSVEKEKEIEIEIESDKRNVVPYQLIADMYNEICTSYPKIKSLSDARKKAIKARLKTYTVDDFRIMFEKCEHSGFLKGSNNRNWSATFDWMIKDTNMAKILDGNYDDKKGGSSVEQIEWDPTKHKFFE